MNKQLRRRRRARRRALHHTVQLYALLGILLCVIAVLSIAITDFMRWMAWIR